MNHLAKEIADLEKRKAEQAKVCLEKRTENVAAVKLERRVWSAGVARVLTSYVGE